MEEKYIASLDIGTTTVRCFIFNSRAETVGVGNGQVELLYPKPGHVEINPNKLWDTVVEVIKDAIKDAHLTAGQITCLGISTQRCSFTCWNSLTGRPIHNFITWKDLRANKIVKQWNESFSMKGLRMGAHCLYLISRSKRFLAGSVLRIMNGQVTPRLAWCLQNIPELIEAVREKNAMFGTVDTWIMYKLTGGKLHCTDYSNASATGLYDPFTFAWADWAQKLFRIPGEILPKVVDTAGNIANVDGNIFGASIPIRSLMADQSASMFGSCCFDPGDLKVTLGTGSFLNVNTGRSAHASATGIYPVIAWKYGDELCYSVEGASNDTGSLIQWAMSIDLFSNPSLSSEMAQSVESNDGVFFIPGFSGLGPPINDYKAAAGFFGLKPTTKKPHLVRAILESIVFRVVQLFDVVDEETKFCYNRMRFEMRGFRTAENTGISDDIEKMFKPDLLNLKTSLCFEPELNRYFRRVDGGVSKNDFICQLLSDMTDLTVERSKSSELSVLGAAYLAGLSAGIWKNREDIKNLKKIEREFQPNEKSTEINREVLEDWSRVIDRFKNWYQTDTSEIKRTLF